MKPFDHGAFGLGDREGVVSMVAFGYEDGENVAVMLC